MTSTSWCWNAWQQTALPNCMGANAVSRDGLAKVVINSLLKKYPLHVGEQYLSIVISAGVLKCQHPDALSYNDCLSIAYCLNNRCSFHKNDKRLHLIAEKGKTIAGLEKG